MDRWAKCRSLKLLEFRVNIPKPVFPTYFSLKYCCYTKWQEFYWPSESQRSSHCLRLPRPRKGSTLLLPKINTLHHAPTLREFYASHYIIVYFAHTCAHALPGICRRPILGVSGSVIRVILCIFCNLRKRLFCCSRWGNAKRRWLSFIGELPLFLKEIAGWTYW
jgi:hypothetical protein